MLLLLLQLGECSKDVTLYELGSQSRTCAPLFGASVRPVGCVAATPTSLLGGECFGHKFVLCIGTYATTDGVEDILRERQRERERKREAGQPVIRQSTSAISCSRSLRLHNVRVTEQTNCLTKRANNPEQFSVLSECVCVCICVCEWAQRSIEIAVAASWIAATNSTKRCFCPAQDLFKAMTNAGDTSPFSLALALCLSLYLSPPLSLFLFLHADHRGTFNCQLPRQVRRQLFSLPHWKQFVAQTRPLVLQPKVVCLGQQGGVQVVWRGECNYWPISCLATIQHMAVALETWLGWRALRLFKCCTTNCRLKEISINEVMCVISLSIEFVACYLFLHTIYF